MRKAAPPFEQQWEREAARPATEGRKKKEVSLGKNGRGPWATQNSTRTQKHLENTREHTHTHARVKKVFPTEVYPGNFNKVVSLALYCESLFPTLGWKFRVRTGSLHKHTGHASHIALLGSIRAGDSYTNGMFGTNGKVDLPWGETMSKAHCWSVQVIDHELCLKAHSVEQALNSCACRTIFTTSGRGPVKIAKV